MVTSRIRYSIVLSAIIQLALGAFTAHPYDGRVFLAAGYSVAHGNSPYVPVDVSGVFGKELFPDPITGIGYPPPWSLVLAIVCLASYNLFPNLIFYNFAMKVPIVIVNILLALLVGRAAFSETSDNAVSDRATRFMLFNPYVIYSTAIWGQFDTASVLLMLLSILMFSRGRRCPSAIALGGAIALKVLPIALAPLLIICEKKRAGWLKAVQYATLTAAAVAAAFAPFVVFGWSIEPVIDNWNVHFIRVGGFSPMYLLILFGIDVPTGSWEMLGYLWIPALALVYYVISRKPNVKLPDLLLSALATMLALSLTRSWVSEQNLNFVLPLVLLASIAHVWSARWVTATWALPLVFGLLHTAPTMMLFLVMPEPFHCEPSLEQFLNDVGRIGRPVIAFAWLLIGASLLRKLVREERSIQNA